MKDLERLSGIPRSTIHYYLREGLMPQPQKRGKTVADYGSEHLKTLQLIKRLQDDSRMSLDEIRRFLRRGRPHPDPKDLGRSLDMLVYYAAAHAQTPQRVESELLNAFEAAVDEAEGLDDAIRSILKERILAWWAQEHALLGAAARREIDVIFRSVLETGRLDNARPVFQLIARLSEAGRRSMGRVVRDKMVLEFLASIRTILQHEDPGPHGPDPRPELVRSGSLEPMDRMRVLAWTGHHQILLSEFENPSAPKDLRELEAQALHGWSRSVASKSKGIRLVMGPAPDESSEIANYLCSLIEGRGQILASVRNLRSNDDMSPQYLQALLVGLERLESIPLLALDVDPWVALLIETQVGVLLTNMPEALSFRLHGRNHSKRALERLSTLDSDHPVVKLGVAEIVRLNLQGNSL